MKAPTRAIRPKTGQISNLFHHAPINVEPFAEIKLHGFDEHAGFKLLAARDDVP